MILITFMVYGNMMSRDTDLLAWCIAGAATSRQIQDSVTSTRLSSFSWKLISPVSPTSIRCGRLPMSAAEADNYKNTTGLNEIRTNKTRETLDCSGSLE